ncbi:MAG: hypothetical protein J7M40_13210 [Planctomycetes bacterium]|nr:hypothetical protein [Planctomycetota bacterium]
MGTDAIAVYLEQINRAVAKGDATEHTHRPALKGLIESLGKNITATNGQYRGA